MEKPVYIGDIIRDVITCITPGILPTIQANEIAALGKTGITTINFQKGHAMELISTLAMLEKSPQLRDTKYPLVWLVQDFKEPRGQKAGIYASVMLNIVIAHQTVNTYTITDRDAKVFKPVLYPIYYALLDGLNDDSRHIMRGPLEVPPHTKTDLAYMGKQAIGGTSANVLNDFVDAIDISGLALNVLYNC